LPRSLDWLPRIGIGAEAGAEPEVKPTKA
jgi:hypothetical protein